MTIELTPEQVDLLQEILICMTDSNDWKSNTDKSFLEARVLFEFDESLPSKVSEIYNQLF